MPPEATMTEPTTVVGSISSAAAAVPNNNTPVGGTTATSTATPMANGGIVGGNSCLDEQIERLKRCEYLREGEVKALCLRAREILVDESNVQRVDAPVTVSSLFSIKEATCLSGYEGAYRHESLLFHASSGDFIGPLHDDGFLDFG